MRRRFGKNDWIFLGVLLLVCLGCLAGFRLLYHKEGDSVAVTRDGELLGTYELSLDQTVEIRDYDGNVTNILTISGGQASMTEADCPDQLCVHQKAISTENENIVCLPNRVVVTVTASGSEGLDGFAQ